MRIENGVTMLGEDSYDTNQIFEKKKKKKIV